LNCGHDFLAGCSQLEIQRRLGIDIDSPWLAGCALCQADKLGDFDEAAAIDHAVPMVFVRGERYVNRSQ
jgi:hypothetical protein